MDLYELLAAGDIQVSLHILGQSIYGTPKLCDLSRQLCVSLHTNGRLWPSEYYSKAADLIGISNLIAYERLWELDDKYRRYDDKHYSYRKKGNITAEQYLKVLHSSFLKPNHLPSTQTPDCLVASLMTIDPDARAALMTLSSLLDLLQNDSGCYMWDEKYKALREDDEYTIEKLHDVDDDVYDPYNNIVGISGVAANIALYTELPKLIECLKIPYIHQLMNFAKDVKNYRKSAIIPEWLDLSVEPITSLIPEWLMVIVKPEYSPKYEYSECLAFYRDIMTNFHMYSNPQLYAMYLTIKLSGFCYTDSASDCTMLRALHKAVGHQTYVRMFYYYEYAIADNITIGKEYVNYMRMLVDNDRFKSSVGSELLSLMDYKSQQLARYIDTDTYGYACAAFYHDDRLLFDAYYTKDNIKLIIECLDEMGIGEAVPVLLPLCCRRMYKR